MSINKPTRASSRVNKGIPPTRLIETAYLGTTDKLIEDPKNRTEAICGPNQNKWNQAILEELKSLHENNVWELTELPENRKPIGSKWVFKTKTDAQGSVNRYKVRLVAQGFSQKYGTDYDEVFAPVVKNTTLKTLLAVAGKTGMKVKHYDIKTAFLNGELSEEVYMIQPEGYEVKGKEHLVCKLKKSIYGLKQSARTWSKKFADVLLEKGFKRGDADPCLFSKMINGKWIYILIYVDDLIIAGLDDYAINHIENILRKEFEISNLGDLKFYLGIQFERDENGLFRMHQETYIRKLLKRFDLTDARDSEIPMDPGYRKRTDFKEKLPDKNKYQEAIGSLLYVTVNTRPDIALSVSVLSRKVSDPSKADWMEIKRIFRYLKATIHKKLMLGDIEHKDDEELIGYADADWAGNTTDRKSNTGYVFKIYGGTISWGSRKQQCVALSSTEAEYIALTEASQEAIWIQRLLKDFHQENIQGVTIFEDNQSCLKMLDSEKVTQRSKHIDTRYHFARDLKTSGTIKFKYCPTTEMVADILTKPLEVIKIKKFSNLIGLC